MTAMMLTALMMLMVLITAMITTVRMDPTNPVR
jgi:hypothetical protein